MLTQCRHCMHYLNCNNEKIEQFEKLEEQETHEVKKSKDFTIITTCEVICNDYAPSADVVAVG